jgi:hypothetical protein
MIKTFNEFIKESYGREEYILYIRLNEDMPYQKMKSDVKKILEIGEGDNLYVLTSDNTRASIQPSEVFLYPFYQKNAAESFLSEIGNTMNISEYDIYIAEDNNPLMKYFHQKF